jgi:hypothetical protein
MRLCTIALFGLLSTFGILYGQHEGDEHPAEVGIHDYDQQISLLKQEIARYNSLAMGFDRKATQLRSKDFSGYRNAATLRDKCREIVSDLQKHLEELEKQETALIESQKKAEKK